MIEALLLSTVLTVDLQGRFFGTLPEGGDVVLRLEQVQGRTVAWLTSLQHAQIQMPVPQIQDTEHGARLVVLFPDGEVAMEVQQVAAGLELQLSETGATTVLQRVSPLGPHTTWGGDLPMASGDVEPIVVHVTPDNGPARLDLPARSVWQYPIQVDTQADGTLAWTIPGDGHQLMVKPVGDTAPGIAVQGEDMVPLTMHRNPLEVVERPQEPTGDVPWTSSEVTLTLRIETTVSGTLVLPAGNGVDTLVVLVPGRTESRNGLNNAHRPLLVLADTLARAGVASLRIDAPGQGGSDPWPEDQGPLSWSKWSLQLSGIIEQLREQGNWKELIIAGLDDGAMSALMTAARLGEDIDGVILLSPPALPRSVIESEQLRALLRSRGVPADNAAAVVQARLEFIRLGFEHVHDGAMREAARTWLSTMALKAGGLEPTDDLVNIVIERLRAPGRLRDLAEEPRRFLPRITAPVLAIWGKQDRLLDAAQHAHAAVEAVERLGGTIESHVLERGSHWLRPVPQPGRGVTTVRRTFLPETLTIIEDWIQPVRAVRPAQP